jgi:HEAT repeat protein
MKLTSTLLLLIVAATSARASYVTDAVAQMPARNSTEESVLAAKIMGGGAPAIKEVFAMLVPLGTEGKDDTQARLAVGALVLQVGRSGGETDRAMLARTICEALAGDADSEIKSFYICRLQEIGHNESVPALAALLGDERLGLYASAALERIGTPAACEALVKALPSSAGARRVGIVKSLGALRCADAAAEIRKAATNDDKTLRMAALWALANIGDTGDRDDKPAAGLFELALQKDKPAYDQSRLYSWTILLAQRKAEAGSKPQASTICHYFLDGPLAASTPSNVRIAAARLLAESEGQAALGVILPLAEKGDVQCRAGALDAIARTPGETITPALVGRLKSEVGADVKIELLNSLAKRGDVAARPAVIDAAKDADSAVRLAAISALVSLGHDEAISPLVELVASDNADAAKTAAEALSRMPGDKSLAAAAGALATGGAKAKVALLELLAARGATAHKDVVLKQATDADDAVRLAAFKAMEKLGGESDAPKLIELAIAAKDDADAAAALKAAAAAAAHSEDAEHRSDAFVAALGATKGPRRTLIERAVAKVGGAGALAIVVADLKSNDKATREGALSALADWQGSAAVAPLLEAAKSADAGDQVTAIRGVVQVLRAATNMSAAEKTAAYSQAIAAAKRPEEKKMILGAIGSERGQEMFDIAASFLDEEGLKAEASLAAIKTALPAAKGQAGLKGVNVVEALKKAIPGCPDGGLKADAERYLKKLELEKK